MHTAPPDAPRGHEARTNPGRPGNTRACPGGMRRVSQQCERLYTPDTIGVVVTPVLCPAGVAGVYAMSTGTTGCVRVMCASDGSRWNLELDDRRWILSSCARIAWNRVAPRETRYAHAGDGKVLSSLFPKEKLRSLRMSALTNESMPPHKVLVFDTETSGLIPRDNGKFRRTLRNWINAHHEKGFAIFPTIRKSPNRTNAGSSSTTAAFSRLSNVASFRGQAI